MTTGPIKPVGGYLHITIDVSIIIIIVVFVFSFSPHVFTQHY